MNILAFGASSSSQSINQVVAHYAASQVAGANLSTLGTEDYELPLYSSDNEAKLGIPAKAQQLFDTIGRVDAIIISFAEHNGSYTAAYKNLFDWMSRIDQKVFQDKPMVLLATSPGPGGAQNVLASAVQSAPYFGGKVVASLSIPSYFTSFDNGEPATAELKDALLSAIAQLTTE